MGGYLTYQGSSSLASSATLPDENYAREFMQLFSIGLNVLRDDGTLEVDSAGNAIQTYDNNDIMNFARVWTGA